MTYLILQTDFILLYYIISNNRRKLKHTYSLSGLSNNHRTHTKKNQQNFCNNEKKKENLQRYMQRIRGKETIIEDLLGNRS